MATEEVTEPYNPYFKYSDAELIRFAHLRAASNLEIELATRLGDALDAIDSLEEELKEWNPWCRSMGKTHDA